MVALFSIIVPVYKAEDTIERCVESIRKQTIKDIEIILVDDGNIDMSGEKCEEQARLDNRVKVIHQDNSGPSVARNSGIKIASGSWVTFCDADDEMLEDACEKYLKKASEGAYDVVIADIYRVSNNQNHIRLFDEGTLWKNKKDIDALINLTMCYKLNPFADNVGISKFGYGGPWNKAIKLSLLKKYNIVFPESIRQYEDRLFNMRVYSHATSIGYVSSPVYKYYATENSLTRGRSSDIFELNQRIFSEYKDFFKDNSVENADKAFDVMVTERFIFFIRNAFSNRIKFGEFVENYKLVKKILRLPVYAESLSKTSVEYIGGFDKYMVGMLKKKIVFLTCACYAFRGHIGR